MPKSFLMITGELFKQMFHLPAGTVVARDIYVTVEHPDIPEGTFEVTARYKRDPDGVVTFHGWEAVER